MYRHRESQIIAKHERAPTEQAVGLVAHDGRKRELVEWSVRHWDLLSNVDLVCTGTTGQVVGDALRGQLEMQGVQRELRLHRVRSGRLGGDQQLGAMVVEGRLRALVFFWDPLATQPHDSDVKALLRIAVMYDLPVACNVSTADCVVAMLGHAGARWPKRRASGEQSA
jgi:methylglyoxal synthase